MKSFVFQFFVGQKSVFLFGELEELEEQGHLSLHFIWQVSRASPVQHSPQVRLKTYVQGSRRKGDFEATFGS